MTPNHDEASRVSRLSGKWKLELIYVLSGGSLRWKALNNCLPDASPNVLTRQLRQLEADGLVLRTVIAQTPPQVVEYELTEEGKAVLPVLEALAEWRTRYAG